ncbi:MAG: tRNA (5-methylaminomethyl-2-thiouridine)(34)-methyltransferase MnmD [Muribaculaceae bacterium]|nr:tRNA (5-methylaminomethyl-2-thiouridine)(34)-methyltransferase MnmD [Muribaculaceae bacterium]
MDKQEEILIEATADGSHTLYIPSIDEHYHSIKGALAESNHVYIDTCWRKAAVEFGQVRLFEVGFGTGLNAALTAAVAFNEKIPTVYFSAELHPLNPSVISALDYSSHTPFHAEIIKAEWGIPVEIHPYFILIKLADNFLTMNLPDGINAVYYDAFAPEKQPEMWSSGCIERIRSHMIDRGVLSTYCAKGIIRRRLQSAGFTVERLPGPPCGKREILRATAE